MTDRAQTSRDATVRDYHPGDDERALYIDPAIIPPGMDWQWKREFVLGQPDPDNIRLALRQGWKPVMAEQHPNLAAPALPGQDADKLIRSGGLLLMERPMEKTLQERAWHQQQNREIERSVDTTRPMTGKAEHYRQMKPEVRRTVERNPGNGRKIAD
jgi:hypothetical protein